MNRKENKNEVARRRSQQVPEEYRHEVLEGWSSYFEESGLVSGSAELVFKYVKDHANEFLADAGGVYELIEEKVPHAISWKSRDGNSYFCRFDFQDIAEKACKVRYRLSFDRPLGPADEQRRGEEKSPVETLKGMKFSIDMLLKRLNDSQLEDDRKH